jgi:membrane associated rhomboid family serine protease
VRTGKLLLILCLLLLLGLLPWVDNYAHIVGFFTGFLLAYALMPYISFQRSRQRTQRLILMSGSLLAALLVYAALFAVFYAVPARECEWCKYLTCIPFTQDFCADQNINFKKDEPIVNF